MQTEIRLPFPIARVDRAPERSPPTEVEWKSAAFEIQRFRSFASAETCRQIVELGSDCPEEPGEMEGSRGGRENSVRWLPFDSTTNWLSDLVARLFLRANRRFRFELAGFAEPLHIIEYRPGDHIDWHVDCGSCSSSTRKLGATILLSEPHSFTGGDLMFAGLTKALQSESIGEATVFPAFFGHRVTPIKSGTRKVLAAWAHGPVFR